MMKKKKELSIDPFVLVFIVIVACGLATFIIPPGILENGVYTALPRNAVNFNNLFNIFRAFPYGLKESANIFVIILIVGGALEIAKKSGAVDTGIIYLIQKFGKRSSTAILILLIITFSAIGGFMGWVEELIPFVPLVVMIVVALGYDTITAVAICIVGTMGGFMAGPTNLFTVGVCNEIIIAMGLTNGNTDVFQGIQLRLIVWVLVTMISIVYILIYAKRVKSDPLKSLTYGIDISELQLDTSGQQVSLSIRHILILLTFVGALVLSIIGMKSGIDGVIWSFDDVSGAFFLAAVLIGIIAKISPSDIANAFIFGAKESLSGALIVGIARGVYWVLKTANVTDTIVYNATLLLEGTSPLVAAIGIVIIVSLINGLIPSGSGKGALLAPIMVPIATSLGLTSQTAVLAYQWGDGITNMFWFTFGTLLIFLNYGKVPINKWYRFFIPLMAIFFVLAIIVLAIAVKIGY